MRKTTIPFLLLLLLPAVVFAQQINNNTLTTKNTSVLNSNGTVNLHTDINLREMDLSKQEMIYVVPTLVSSDSANSLRFDPIIIAAPTRYKALNRSLEFNNIHFDENPGRILRYHKGCDLMFPLDLTFAYQPWMDHSKLIIVEDRSGCGCTTSSSTQYTVLEPVLPAQFVPTFETSYVAPPAEAVKQRSETYSARINFELNKYQIPQHYKHNSEVLNDVDKIINEIKNDKNLTVAEFKVTGYASPEGNSQSNMTLSKNRAEAFVGYLMDKYGIERSDISTNWKGEDWEGLRQAVENTNMSHKTEVLAIIDRVPNIMTRKNNIKKLDGGVPYKQILNELYPPLRRNDYTISYVPRAFDVDEAREIIKTKPHHLSQDEMYRVANSYPRNSREFKEVLDIMAGHYPNDEISVMNNMAYRIEYGEERSVIGISETLNRPEAWNNLGIAYFKMKDYEKAGAYFSRAAAAGHQTGIDNLAQYNIFMQSTNPTGY